MQWGIVNHVVPQDELMATCEKMAGKMIKNSPNAQAEAIVAINAGFKEGVDGYEAEIENFGRCFGTPEFVEGTTAFMEKRKAEF
ncbi:MAG: enoyl-CoA hydratase-related protein, partial [Schleiferiaceae bacterium]|nr:enoyl-CoA hydratase-related protein [Schleiferiaceae bacterium]